MMAPMRETHAKAVHVIVVHVAAPDGYQRLSRAIASLLLAAGWGQEQVNELGHEEDANMDKGREKEEQR